MASMKAAIFNGPNQIELREVDRTRPMPGYVTLDTKVTGICGTDLHFYAGHWPPSDTFALGHETCGVVIEVGEGVTGFEPGDLVAVEYASHCGWCVYCRTGNYNHCLDRQWVSEGAHGGFAEFTSAHASGMHKLPAGMTAEQGALVEPLAVAVRAVAQTGATGLDRLAIIGGGTIGLMCLAVAKAAGIHETVITVKYEQQARLAEVFGADHIVNVTSATLGDAVAAMTNGLGADAVIETVGSARNFDEALASVRRRGTVVLVGGYFEPVSVDLWPIVASEALVTGSICYGYSGTRNDFQAAIGLIASGAIPVTETVTHRFSLDRIPDAFKVAGDKRSGAVKVQIDQTI